ncbi:LOW QUALITY PROTEIN: putative sulfide reductase [Geomicrobium sp. JCM 19037]|nr:LOW QUALITY PROTEIN: putative sulfide reductase [Geomicrobium sp. JCM 19037]
MSEEKTTNIILFSGDYDKAMAAYIIANGAAAYDHKVTIFHTFWGLNALRKDEPIKANKSLMEKCLAKCLVDQRRGVIKDAICGCSPKLIKNVMKKHNAMPLADLIDLAEEQDINLVACTMTLDLLGLQKEELRESSQYAGVAAYLADAEDGNVNLFI